MHNILGTNLQHHQPGECLSLSTAEQLLWAPVCQIKGELIPTSQGYSESWNQPALGWSWPSLGCRAAGSLQPELQAELCCPEGKSKPAFKGRDSLHSLFLHPWFQAMLLVLYKDRATPTLPYRSSYSSKSHNFRIILSAECEELAGTAPSSVLYSSLSVSGAEWVQQDKAQHTEPADKLYQLQQVRPLPKLLLSQSDPALLRTKRKAKPEQVNHWNDN